jgi:2-polyprenyl-3-methyl-5-hydroxy-6-metoxy-1,4-benzoquinol methylase
MDFTQRSYQQELLDRKDIPFVDIARNMQELNFINSHLGGHNITIHGLQKILATSNHKRSLIVCEMGCGGGDNLQVIYDWCKKKNLEINTIGIDINPDCIEYAKKSTHIPSSKWIASDYKTASLPEKPDIIFNSLFCHHFTDEEMIHILKWMNEHSKIGFFINDLHRHVLAFYSIKFLTQLFSRSYLVKNDAPLSVQRGFTRNEIEQLIHSAGIADFDIEWKWAFRWLITSTNKKN